MNYLPITSLLFLLFLSPQAFCTSCTIPANLSLTLRYNINRGADCTVQCAKHIFLGAVHNSICFTRETTRELHEHFQSCHDACDHSMSYAIRKASGRSLLQRSTNERGRVPLSFVEDKRVRGILEGRSDFAEFQKGGNGNGKICKCKRQDVRCSSRFSFLKRNRVCWCEVDVNCRFNDTAPVCNCPRPVLCIVTNGVYDCHCPVRPVCH